MTTPDSPGTPGDGQPVDPYAPVDYPAYPDPSAYPPPQAYPPPSAYPPPAYPPPAAYPPPSAYPPPPASGYPQAPIPPSAYPPPVQPGYPGPYANPYDPYGRPQLPGTNGLAIGAMVTSIVGALFGIPLTLMCWIGFLVPIVGAVLGIVALNQIKRTGQAGRGMAIAGIVIGAVGALITVVAIIVGLAALASSSY